MFSDPGSTLLTQIAGWLTSLGCSDEPQTHGTLSQFLTKSTTGSRPAAKGHGMGTAHLACALSFPYTGDEGGFASWGRRLNQLLAATGKQNIGSLPNSLQTAVLVSLLHKQGWRSQPISGACQFHMC